MRKKTIEVELTREDVTPDVSVGYITLREFESVARTLPLHDEQINIDFDAEGRIVGIEVLDGKLLPEAV